MPKLVQVDLSRADKHRCPGIIPGKTYLVKVHGEWYAGSFEEQWYGLNFLGIQNGAGLQFDAPGFNFSSWEEVYEIYDDHA